MSIVWGGCRNVTRRLCKPHAISITTSDIRSFVNLNVSLTIRHLFTPLMTFSTTILTRAISLFTNFSVTVNSAPLTFFWVVPSIRLPVRNPENLCLSLKLHFLDSSGDSLAPASCRAFSLLPSRLNTLLAECFH